MTGTDSIGQIEINYLKNQYLNRLICILTYSRHQIIDRLDSAWVGQKVHYQAFQIRTKSSITYQLFNKKLYYQIKKEFIPVEYFF